MVLLFCSFNTHTGMFEGMDWSNVFCAGGSVLACVTPQQGGVYRGSDIDLWIYGLRDDDAANAKVKHIHSIISRNAASRGQVVRTNRAITILGEYPFRHVQIILRCEELMGKKKICIFRN